MKPVFTVLNSLISSLNGLAPEILERMGWACVGGGILALIVGGCCRLFRIPANLRVWLWWLVSLKFLVGFVPAIAALSLTIAVPKDTPAAPLLRTLTVPPTRPALPPSSVSAKDTASRVLATNSPDAGSNRKPESIAPSPVLSLPPLSLLSLLLLGYFSGLTAALLLTARETMRLQRLIRASVPAVDPVLLDVIRQISQEVGLRRIPGLYISEDITAPLVTNFWQPVALLPRAFIAEASPEAIRLALRHELLHIKRGDLRMGLVPFAGRTLFWWFPLAGIACREWEQAREEACDQAVIASEATTPLAYGRLLVQMATGDLRSQVNIASLGAPGASPLKRRLKALRYGVIRLKPLERLLVLLLLTGITTACLPYRLRAVLPIEPALAIFTAPTPRYEIVPLGTFGGEYSDAYSINDAGTVAGTASLEDRQGRGHAFLTDADGDLQDLSAGSDFPRSMAHAVNSNGTVAATAFYRSGKPQAFFYDGKRHYIGTLPGFGYSQAKGINDRGMLTGTALRFRRQWGYLPARAWVWQNGVMRDIGTLGGEYSHGFAINRAGLVVGKADLARARGEDGMTHAFLWDPVAGMRDLGALKGGQNSRAMAINDDGEIVGVSETGTGGRQAFITAAGRSMAALPSLPDAMETSALGINAQGQVVGNAVYGAQDSRALLWVRSVGETGSRVLDLNSCISPDSGWKLLTARAINARGEIVGQGIWNGKRRAFLLRPQPENNR